MNRAAFRFSLLLLLIVAIGCGKSGGRRDISGRVTYNGKPVFYGTIYFEPDASAGHGGPQGSGEIHDGVYRTNPEYGPTPGPHVVRISGWDGSPGGTPPVFTNYETRVDLPDADQKDLNFDVPLMRGKRPPAK